jgi:hypothetical protein
MKNYASVLRSWTLRDSTAAVAITGRGDQRQSLDTEHHFAAKSVPSGLATTRWTTANNDSPTTRTTSTPSDLLKNLRSQIMTGYYMNFVYGKLRFFRAATFDIWFQLPLASVAKL